MIVSSEMLWTPWTLLSLPRKISEKLTSSLLIQNVPQSTTTRITVSAFSILHRAKKRKIKRSKFKTSVTSLRIGAKVRPPVPTRKILRVLTVPPRTIHLPQSTRSRPSFSKSATLRTRTPASSNRSKEATKSRSKRSQPKTKWKAST